MSVSARHRFYAVISPYLPIFSLKLGVTWEAIYCQSFTLTLLWKSIVWWRKRLPIESPRATPRMDPMDFLLRLLREIRPSPLGSNIRSYISFLSVSVSEMKFSFWRFPDCVISLGSYIYLIDYTSNSFFVSIPSTIIKSRINSFFFIFRMSWGEGMILKIWWENIFYIK